VRKPTTLIAESLLVVIIIVGICVPHVWLSMAAREKYFAGLLALDHVLSLAVASAMDEGKVMVRVVVGCRVLANLRLGMGAREQYVLADITAKAEGNSGRRNVQIGVSQR
jgi:hypothetical protein